MSQTAKEVNSQELFQVIDHIRSIPHTRGNIIRPLFVWGKPGYGKTEMIREYAEQRNLDFIYCAPAQFEEMGDLHGIPEIENGKTVFRRPSWLPEPTERPGIILLDDMNRADPRIIKGFMQLAQLHELMSWKLPKNYLIICTGNPDGGEYSTTMMDSAVMTRFIHVNVQFDKNNWAEWAMRNDIPTECINFVLTYPETITSGNLTNARTISSFFRSIADLNPRQDHFRLIEILGHGLLDPETVESFIGFLKNSAERIPEPEVILFSKDTKQLTEDLRNLLQDESGVRLDLFSTTFNRLMMRCQQGPVTKVNLENLIALFTIEEIPNDFRTYMAMEFGKLKQKELLDILTDGRIGQALLNAA